MVSSISNNTYSHIKEHFYLKVSICLHTVKWFWVSNNDSYLIVMDTSTYYYTENYSFKASSIRIEYK